MNRWSGRIPTGRIFKFEPSDNDDAIDVEDERSAFVGEMFYLVPSHVDVRSVQKDPPFTTEQPEQDSDPVTPCHAGIDRELVAERTVQDTHSIAWTELGWQLDRTFALARSDFRNHSVGDLSRCCTVHHQAARAGRPPRLPPPGHDAQEGIAGK
jgi:hypothetical protein